MNTSSSSRLIRSQHMGGPIAVSEHLLLVAVEWICTDLSTMNSRSPNGDNMKKLKDSAIHIATFQIPFSADVAVFEGDNRVIYTAVQIRKNREYMYITLVPVEIKLGSRPVLS